MQIIPIMISLTFLCLLTHAAGFDDKTAYAQCIFAYTPGPDVDPITFVGRTPGRIVPARGPSDFGWDPIFEADGFGKVRMAVGIVLACGRQTLDGIQIQSLRRRGLERCGWLRASDGCGRALVLADMQPELTCNLCWHVT